MRITEYPQVNSSTDMQSSDVIITDGTNGTKKALFSTFATWLLNVYTGLSVAGSQQTIRSAINSMWNSTSPTINISLGTATTASMLARKTGRFVCIHNFVIGASSGTPFSGATGSDTIGTLPEGYRPAGQVRFPILMRTVQTVASATYYVGELMIDSNGTMTVNANAEHLRACRYIYGGGITFIS